jgi:hypothetical protein
MSEIFYSQVDAALQAELNARGRAGKTDRSTKALNFMLGKVANVEMTAYENESREKELHILGGTRVRSGEYLPSGTTSNPGFLDDRRGSVETLSWVANENTGEIQVDSTTNEFVNSSKRIPPYITSADINIGDHSMGLLNKSTINVTIPNPDRDLNFFESVWLRPGRHVIIALEHPNSAVITDGTLQDSLPSVEKILKTNPSLSASDINRFKKMNRYEFYGLITNFSFVYNEDATVSATINLTGASNVYTDVSLLMSPSKKNRNEININIENSSLFGTTTETINGEEVVVNFTPPAPLPPAENETDETTRTPLPLFDDLERETKERIQSYRDSTNDVTNPVTLKQFDSEYNWLIDGKPYNSGSVEAETYITLSWLVDYMNRVIVNKRKKASTTENGTGTFTDLIKIICTEQEDLCTSNYYSEITSGNPSTIFLFSENKKLNTYGDLVWYQNIKGAPTFQTADTAYPSRIFINLQYIYDIIKSLSADVKTFNVNSFFKEVSYAIAVNTGRAINLSLITHPEIDSALLFYDANRIKTRQTTQVTEYPVPMFANNSNGTVVRQFAFNAKIPDSVKNLSYVLNQNPAEISELDVAPYMNFMYNSSNAVRTTDIRGNVIEQQNPDAQVLLDKLKTQYRETHIEFLNTLRTAKINFGKNPTSPQRIAELREALTKYVQYPTPLLTETNQLTAPMYPFDVEITIDGINGFRYGDVLQFLGLPERYRRNAVFSIINITHTVSNSGEWTTKLKCIMRPKFE